MQLWEVPGCTLEVQLTGIKCILRQDEDRGWWKHRERHMRRQNLGAFCRWLLDLQREHQLWRVLVPGFLWRFRKQDGAGAGRFAVLSSAFVFRTIYSRFKTLSSYMLYLYLYLCYIYIYIYICCFVVESECCWCQVKLGGSGGETVRVPGGLMCWCTLIVCFRTKHNHFLDTLRHWGRWLFKRRNQDTFRRFVARCPRWFI